MNTTYTKTTEQSNFKNYYVISKLDQEWGFAVNNAGHTQIDKNTSYPPNGHPDKYMFSWDKGRVLTEYQLVIISKGSGKFESKSAGKLKIKKDDAFLLFPDEWHRYKPHKKTGWIEHWVGFSGKIANTILNNNFFKKNKPLVSSFNNQLVKKYILTLKQLLTEQPYGFQQSASGICIQLLIEFCNLQNGAKLNYTSFISRAKYIMNEKIDEEIDFKYLSANLGLSYSKFRYDFKKQTGLPPRQYFLLLKLEKAKDLLRNSNIKCKQIAYDLGFESNHYFSRLFKQKTGVSPEQFRNFLLKSNNNE